jgi:hypothetical protein
MQSIFKWWNEGETGATRIYRQSMGQFVATVAASVAVIVLLPSLRTWYVMVICICISGRALAERRRALIFTDSSVIYRPVFRTVVRIQFVDVASVEECTASVSFWFRVQQFKGLRIHLKNHRSTVIPLDFPESQAIRRQLLRDWSV